MNQHKFQILALLVSITVLASPEVSVDNKKYRGMSASLKIKSQELSPATAALEDSRHWDEAPVVMNQKAPTIQLRAGDKEADQVIPGFEKQAVYKPLKGVRLNYSAYVVKQQQLKQQKIAIKTKQEFYKKTARTLATEYSQSSPLLVSSSSKKQADSFEGGASSSTRPTQEFKEVSKTDYDISQFQYVRAMGNIKLQGLPLIFEDQVVELVYQNGILESPIEYKFPYGFDTEVIKGQGKILAKLWSKTSGLVGEGELLLKENLNYKDLQVSLSSVSYKHKGNLLLTSAHASANEFLISMDSSSNKISLKDQNYSLNLDVKSQPLMVAGLKGQKTSTLYTFNHKTENTWPIYTDEYALFLANLLNKRATAVETTALVSGKVTYLGQALSNVKIVLHQGLLEKPATYFSSSLPNPSLSSTSSSGQFVAATNTDRPAAVSVLINNKVVHRRDIPIGLGQVTHVNIEIGPQQSLTYDLTSAIENEPLNATFHVESTNSAYSIINGIGKLYSYSSDMAEKVFVDMQDTEYISFSTWMNSDFKYGKIYASKKSWFYKITEGEVENFNEQSSIYIGYVGGADYKVKMDKLANPKIKTIYFDSFGEKIESGKSDGGFIVLNIPPGQRSISVEAVDLEKNHIQFFNAYQSQNFSSLIHF